MRAKHLLLCLAIASSAGLAASAQPQAPAAATPIYSGPLKQSWWGRTALGLAIHRSELHTSCHSLLGTCEELSLVGRASIGESAFNLFGKVGSTTQNVVRTYALGADSGSGLSYGAGVSWDFSRRASATVAWDTYDLRAGGAVRATSLGLQWRY